MSQSGNQTPQPPLWSRAMAYQAIFLLIAGYFLWVDYQTAFLPGLPLIVIAGTVLGIILRLEDQARDAGTGRTTKPDKGI